MDENLNCQENYTFWKNFHYFNKGLKIDKLFQKDFNSRNVNPIKRKRSNAEEEDKIICRDILNMDMNLKLNQTKFEKFTIIIPLNVLNVASLVILFVLILFGSYYIWTIFTRKKCSCKICKNEYILLDRLGEGGFGEVIFKLTFKLIFRFIKLLRKIKFTF